MIFMLSVLYVNEDDQHFNLTLTLVGKDSSWQF